ncbi:hypothetical protein NUM3379_01560 [Kineococcus sp. NUM-3379]
MAGREQFLVVGTPGVLTSLLDLLRRDPDVEVQAVSRAGRGPERLLLSIDPERAAALAAALGSLVVLEADPALDPPGPVLPPHS